MSRAGVAAAAVPNGSPSTGITIREEFVKAILQGMAANPSSETMALTDEQMVTAAIALADRALAALEPAP